MFKLKYSVLLLLLILLTAGCAGNEQTVTFTAEIEKVSENSILVSTIDFDDFGRASVDLREAEYDFNPEEGQIVEITIKPEVRESYPVQVTGVKLVYIGEAKREISEYFPFRENVKYVFEGRGNEFASYDVYTEYISNGRLQQRVDNGGTVTARVFEIKDGKLVRVYSRGEAYYRENLLNQSEDSAEVLLMDPLEKGTAWTLDDGRQRTITGTSTEVQTPLGFFPSIEVVTEGSDSVTVDYYVKGVGLVKTIFQSGGMEVSSALLSVEEDAERAQAVRFYYPDADSGEIYYVKKEVTYRTNDETAAVLEAAYKKAVNETQGTVLSANTAIKNLTLEEDHIVRLDLNAAFVSEMNAGAGYEASILQSIANTFGGYYNAEGVILTVEGEPYESGHISMEEDQSIPVKLEEAEQKN